MARHPFHLAHQILKLLWGLGFKGVSDQHCQEPTYGDASLSSSFTCDAKVRNALYFRKPPSGALILGNPNRPSALDLSCTHSWVAVKELELCYYNKEAPLPTIYSYYGNSYHNMGIGHREDRGSFIIVT